MTNEAGAGTPAGQAGADAGQQVTTNAGQPAGQSVTLPSIAESFTDIPQDFAQDPDFQGMQLKDVFTSFKELKALQKARESNGLIPLPGEDAPPEVVNQFWSKLGKPSSPAEYGFKAPEDLPQGLDYSDDRAAKFAEAAHQLNLTKTQAQGLFEFYHGMLKEEYGQFAASQEEALASNLTQLEQLWGGPQGSQKFTQHHEAAKRAFNTVADPELAAAFKEDPMLSSNPLVLTLLSRLGAKMTPDSAPTVTGSTNTGRFTDSMEGVDRAIKEFYDSGKFKQMTQAGNSAAKELREEWKALYEKRRVLMGGN